MIVLTHTRTSSWLMNSKSVRIHIHQKPPEIQNKVVPVWMAHRATMKGQLISEFVRSLRKCQTFPPSTSPLTQGVDPCHQNDCILLFWGFHFLTIASAVTNTSLIHNLFKFSSYKMGASMNSPFFATSILRKRFLKTFKVQISSFNRILAFKVQALSAIPLRSLS